MTQTIEERADELLAGIRACVENDQADYGYVIHLLREAEDVISILLAGQEELKELVAYYRMPRDMR